MQGLMRAEQAIWPMLFFQDESMVGYQLVLSKPWRARIRADYGLEGDDEHEACMSVHATRTLVASNNDHGLERDMAKGAQRLPNPARYLSFL